LTTWNLVGRVALRSANDGGQASLRWAHTPAGQTIDLHGPLGRGMVRLQQDEHGVRLLDNAQQVYTAENAEALLFNTTGWRIPLEGLNYWIRGVPVPGVPQHLELDDQGRLAVLWQSGWEVRFLAYTRFGEHDLPSRLTLVLPQETDTSPSDPTGRSPVEARLIIERWTLLQ
jgi:outer membrane lipoprotein LolB